MLWFFVVAAVLLLVFLFLLSRFAPTNKISEGRGKGKIAVDYIRENMDDYRGYKELSQDKIMLRPITSKLELHWADGSTSICDVDNILLIKIGMMKENLERVGARKVRPDERPL